MEEVSRWLYFCMYKYLVTEEGLIGQYERQLIITQKFGVWFWYLYSAFGANSHFALLIHAKAQSSPFLSPFAQLVLSYWSDFTNENLLKYLRSYYEVNNSQISNTFR